MHYANPNFQLLVLSIIALVIFFLWALRRRRTLMERFADKNLIPAIAPSLSPRRRVIKVLVVSVAFIMCIIALMRPQWGFEWEEVKRTGLDILLAIDVSKSMLAKDVKPNRLERSKFAVKDLVKKLNGDRVGLIAFAGTAFLQCPLTIDYNGFLLALDDLSTSTIPRPGTSIASAIKEAVETFGGVKADKKYKVLVIITDGEELEGDAMKMADVAAEAGIKIYCVGVGSQEGELIPAVDGRGGRGFLSDKEGRIVKTRLNEELLKKIAIKTGGNYVRATKTEFGLVLLYDKSISRLEKRDIEAKMRKHYEERFQIFLSIALALLFIEPFIPERRKVL
ncbi:MAG: VWA domain-containing protein [Candidatus Omnitrophica bacterium]|nr:VWA domain-containing protein [Candidatus Omnitrophota bacterium]